MAASTDLFETSDAFHPLPMEDADVRLKRAFYPAESSRRYQETLLAQTPWRQEQITICGVPRLQPRLSAWYGDPGTHYTYSGITLAPLPWTPTLLMLKADVEAACAYRFNSVLLNLYRNERDSMGWHSDDEPELGDTPLIASISLGASRIFRFKHKRRRDLRPVSVELTDGSLLVMAGSTQRFWRHAIDKERTRKDARINLTFRTVVARR